MEIFVAVLAALLVRDVLLAVASRRLGWKLRRGWSQWRMYRGFSLRLRLSRVWEAAAR